MTNKSLYEKLSRGGPFTRPVLTTPAVSDRIVTLNSLPSKTYNLRGVETACYTVGALAAVLGKSPVTIRSWEQKGWMPLPKVRTAPPQSPNIKGNTKGRRLYSRQQVEFLITAFETCKLDDSKKADWDQFRSLLQTYPTV